MQKIISDLASLRNDLEESKNPAANYISLLLNLLDDECSNSETIKNTLKRIRSGSKITQLANFSLHQESMWIEVWKDATILLSGV